MTFVTILPTANTCPVQRERAAQTNVSCYTESPAGHRGPSGKAMIRRGRDHSFFYWGQVHERQLQTSDIRRLYLPFRWHQRDPAKVRNFVSRLLHSAAVFWTELRCLPARETNGRCVVGQFWGGGQRETRRMIHLDRRAISRINRMSLYPYLFYLYMTGQKKYFFLWHVRWSRLVATYQLRSICGISVGSDLSLWRIWT